MINKTEEEIIKNWEECKNGKVSVSVCTITYNHGAYIEKAIDSFLMQETSFPFEIVIDDDCSTDNTTEIIKQYMLKFPKIIKANLRETNVGMMINLLGNYKRASGEFIAVCEGDDCWIDKKKLQKQYDFLKNNSNYSMHIHNAYRVNAIDKTRTLFNKTMIPNIIGPKDIILRRWFSPTASFFFRNHIINLPLDESINGDLPLLFLNSLRGKIYYLNEPMSIYNLGTVGSKTETSNVNELYNKKINFLKFVNQKTSNRYILYTGVIFLKTKIAQLLHLIRDK